jgi:lipopolysaccharide/colanic/teichoic acid biosynthesis glycosyltransferase
MEAVVSQMAARTAHSTVPAYRPPAFPVSTPEAPLRLVSARDLTPRAVEDVLPRERSEVASRAVNVTLAAIALAVVSPLLAAVAVLVRLTSKGPILYSQTRVGMDRRFRSTATDDRRAYDHGGKPFRIYKFRTMRVDAEANGRPVWASREDSRLTPIGSMLRKTRVDELPQLFNVLRGDMNIVGPRPERPGIVVDLRNQIPEYHMRLRVRPGITGLAQIHQSYDECLDDVRRKVAYDLDYLRRQSVIEDLRIMSMTIPVMLLRRGGW